MFKSFFSNKKVRAYLGSALLFFTIFASIFVLFIVVKVNKFLNAMEDKTFDLRQSVLAQTRTAKVNKDIILLVVDNASYEYLLTKYGEWPVPRDVHADLVKYIEKQNPKSIAFDLMFIKSIRSKANADKYLAETMAKYNNVYTAINFDYQSGDVRKPINLPKDLSINLKNDSKVVFPVFQNCRAILPEIIASTPNIGSINASRSEDGILRKIPPFVAYKDNVYPHLALLVFMNKLKDTQKFNPRDLYIDKNANLLIGKNSVQLDDAGEVTLNWYGPPGSFTSIPFYRVIKAMNGESNEKFDFENKIIYIGATADSLYDIKSVPVAQVYPGVEIHATFINNFLDNDFIKKVSDSTNIIISLLLGFFIVVVILRTTSNIVAIGATILTSMLYIVFAYYVMKFLNLWVAIVMPLVAIFTALFVAYVVKYINKSRDFEHQYKLATTDGLTELYNHRYFQEQMIVQVENCKRYNSQFSLILIDIDYFKKFNDTYGHQSGDAVLVQVAQKLKRNVRATDFVCRYGGEEMSIILPNTDKNEAIITAQKICQTIAEKPFKLANDKRSQVTISLGVATYPEDGETPSAIIAHSDKCLYNAKENGRNQVGY